MNKTIIGVLCFGLVTFSILSCNNAKQESQPKTDTVIISGMKYNPEVLHVNKGDTVLWINQDIVEHNVTAFPDKEWTSDSIPIDGSWKKVIESSFDYFCSIHPTMKGKIEVNSTP